MLTDCAGFPFEMSTQEYGSQRKVEMKFISAWIRSGVAFSLVRNPKFRPLRIRFGSQGSSEGGRSARHLTLQTTRHP